MRELHRGDVVFANFDPTRGREQAGLRPALIIASNDYLDSVPALAIALPVTTKDRNWPHHVRLTGAGLTLRRPSWAITEQPRTISRDRLARRAGHVDQDCLDEIDQWLRDFLDLA
ncbi:type II toxin-antitoxin system PemK/MazF family toxin [Microlunatus speluncae]|uniref:type II toxin-antitoxin system PemK/MazF family toxin n=1 Tax=Microlunatus speluncae TaxID=2594267 RepID=UPI0012665228|nr:type II toxin-antitoxin system PemK/MazF family toxin [Microlunatus speluncae]